MWNVGLVSPTRRQAGPVSHEMLAANCPCQVLDICKISGIEALLLTAQLRWSGHISRMGATRLPKIVFYGQLAQGTRSLGRQYKCYKDVLKTTLTACGITPTEFELHAADRTSWRSLCKKGIQDFEARRVLGLQEKRSHRKLGNTANTATTNEFQCDICGHDCKSRIGLHSHKRRHPWHPWPGDLSFRWLNPTIQCSNSLKWVIFI